MRGQTFELPRELLESPFPEGFKGHTDMALRNFSSDFSSWTQ